MNRPKGRDLPAEDSEEDAAGLYIVICVSYALPGLLRPRYTSGIYEIVLADGAAIGLGDADSLILFSEQSTIRFLAAPPCVCAISVRLPASSATK